MVSRIHLDKHNDAFGCVVLLILCCNDATDDADDIDAEEEVVFDSVVFNTVLDNIVSNLYLIQVDSLYRTLCVVAYKTRNK